MNLREELTLNEINNWYNNAVKRFGWIVLSNNNGFDKSNYKNELNEIKGHIDYKKNLIDDNDKIRDLELMKGKLNRLNGIMDDMKPVGRGMGRGKRVKKN